jgi:hypothetical protein
MLAVTCFKEEKDIILDKVAIKSAVSHFDLIKS